MSASVIVGDSCGCFGVGVGVEGRFSGWGLGTIQEEVVVGLSVHVCGIWKIFWSGLIKFDPKRWRYFA